MSFDVMRDQRTVQIVPISRTTTDKYNNEVEVEGETSDPIQASRQQLTSTEDITDRDQQSRTFLYFFDKSVQLTGRDYLLDDGNRLRIVGEPELVGGRLPISQHLEATAELIEG